MKKRRAHDPSRGLRAAASARLAKRELSSLVALLVADALPLQVILSAMLGEVVARLVVLHGREQAIALMMQLAVAVDTLPEAAREKAEAGA